MSHALDNHGVLLGLGGDIIDLITPYLYGATLPRSYKFLNYGQFDINPKSGNIELQIRDY